MAKVDLGIVLAATNLDNVNDFHYISPRELCALLVCSYTQRAALI